MTSRRVILNADDLGYDPAVSEGILRSMREGVVTSATLMVNTPFSEDAARAARGLSLGLHLNLARWAPLSRAFPRSLLSEGAFHEPWASRLTADTVASEVEAQLERLAALTGAPATHLDVHKHLHRLPQVLEGVARVAAPRKLPVRSLDEDMRRWLRARGIPTPDHFGGDAGSEGYWTHSRWREALRDAGVGVTELMCHPGLRPSHVQSGYGPQREVELATFTSPDARAALQESGVELTDFRALPR